MSEPINDLDWSATPDSQSILAVGFSHHVEVICQKRKTYFDEDQGWDTCWKVEIGRSDRSAKYFVQSQPHRCSF